MASMGATAAAVAMPEVALRSGSARPMPAVGMGTAQFPVVHEATKSAVLAAIEVGYRHFDTAAMYGTERPLGDAVAEAVRHRLVRSRAEEFVTSKLWCTQCHPDLVLPSLRETLWNLQMEYVDLYLIHWPVCMKPGPATFPAKREDAVPFDFEGVWRAMEECQRLGLAKAIGVSSFTTRHLDRVLAAATIPPAVDQAELNPVWQQRTLRAYCAEKGIHVAAYSPLGGQNWDGRGNAVLESEVLAEIAKARGKSVAQVRGWTASSARFRASSSLLTCGSVLDARRPPADGVKFHGTSMVGSMHVSSLACLFLRCCCRGVCGISATRLRMIGRPGPPLVVSNDQRCCLRTCGQGRPCLWLSSLQLPEISSSIPLMPLTLSLSSSRCH